MGHRSKKETALARRIDAYKSERLAAKGITSGEDFAALMAAVMADVLSGAISPAVANATARAGANYIRVAELQFRYGSQQIRTRQVK